MKDWIKHEKIKFIKPKKKEQIKKFKGDFTPERVVKLTASIAVLGAGTKILGDL